MSVLLSAVFVAARDVVGRPCASMAFKAPTRVVVVVFVFVLLQKNVIKQTHFFFLLFQANVHLFVNHFKYHKIGKTAVSLTKV